MPATAWDCGRSLLPRRPPPPRPDLIVVSNVLTAARAHPQVSQELDPPALAGFLATGVVAGSRTAYRAVVPLPPGHTLIVHRGGRSSLRRHWSFPATDEKVIRDAGAIIEGYRAVLQEAVAERAAARTSVLMSGGIDSTSIAAAARAVAPGMDLHAFTAVYRHATTESELPRARLAADALGIPLMPVDADTPSCAAPSGARVGHSSAARRAGPGRVARAAGRSRRAQHGGALRRGWRHVVPPIVLAGDAVQFVDDGPGRRGVALRRDGATTAIRRTADCGSASASRRDRRTLQPRNG